MANARAAEMEEEREFYVAAMKGNVTFVQEAQNDEVLLRKTRQKYNLIHIATRYEQLEFIKASLEKLPNNYNLISDQENTSNNTPLHVAAEVGNIEIMRELYEYSRRTVDDRDEGGRRKQPWLLKNSKGNTAVHVALIHGNVTVARFLLDKDIELAYIDNNAKEAPLHIAIKQHVSHSESESLVAKIKQPINEGGAGLTTKCVAEEMSSMIEFLVENASSVASVPDAEGVTPLHRAASLVVPYNLKITKLIIEHCPQSAEVFDTNGKSILHLLVNRIPSSLEGRSLLSLKPISALRNHQDQRGNTPLHLAAVRQPDMIMMRLLLQDSTKINVRNVEGACAATLIQHPNVFQILRQRNFTNEETKAASEGNIAFLRERIKMLGTSLFLLSKDSNGKNILHKILQIKGDQYMKRNEFVGFVEEVIEFYPSVLSQTDKNGDTPVHILVRNHLDTKIFVAVNPDNNQGATSQHKSLRELGLLLELLRLCNKGSTTFQFQQATSRSSSPWLLQNSIGNTPLHEALIVNNHALAMTLLTYDKKSAELQNQSKETPLHLLAKIPPHVEPFKREEIEAMVEASHEAASMSDKECLTPLLRAYKTGNLGTARILCDLSPEAASISDADGQTFLHLLVQHPSAYFVFLLLKNLHIRGLLQAKDKEGNTPLHLAIKGNRFDIVEVFLDTWDYKELDETTATELSKDGKDKWLLNLFEIENKAGKSPADLIAESLNLPPNIAKRIGNKDEMIGIRSMWGIPTRQMKTYVNTMGIIAALLTTITFTTAFTLPGGLIENVGTPVLIQQAAFQVFVISDVLAMCLSMMVLFCLLWIMATSHSRQNSVMLLDLSVTLLLASFYATLVTFMSGLFTTLFPIKPWIAIVSLVLSSLFTVLVHKLIVIKLLLPFSKNVVIYYWKFGRFVSKKFKACFNIKSKSGGDKHGSVKHTKGAVLLQGQGHNQQNCDKIV